MIGEGFERPKRSLGQNFLVDPNLQRKVVDALGAGPDDEVVEIGPGRGALTRHLVGAVGRLVLVELDDALAEGLERRFGGRSDVRVLHGDVLDVDLARTTRDWTSSLVIGNIPYNITTPILFRLLEPPRPADIVLMVQREVADRVVAAAGTRDYGALSVGVRVVARAVRLFRVGRGAFRPVPGVDSAVLRVTPIRPAPVTGDEERDVRRLVRAAFQWRRKQLRKILRDHPDLRLTGPEIERALAAAGVGPTDRPERIEPEGFVRLAAALP